MMFFLGAIVIVGTLFSVTTALPPCVCTRERRPVCGSDGKTYSNQCLLDCARFKNPDITLASRGSCKSDDTAASNCICTYEFKPVCGTDGETYPNLCAFQCRQAQQPGIDISYRGECRNVREVENSCVCTRIMKPVCGTDGITYSNPCLLNCVRESNPDLHILHENPCGEPPMIERPRNGRCACTRNLEPVCASNGVTYSNKCMMKCAGSNLTIKSLGSCDES